MINYIRKSLSRKILAVLSASVAMVVAGIIYLTFTHETEEMLNEMTANNEEMASAIYAGIKYPMSIGDSRAVEKELLDIKETVRDIEVFICDAAQKISFSSHEDRLSSTMEKYISSEHARRTLRLALETGEHPENTVEETVGDRKYLVHIHTIFNRKECFRCHGSAKTILGAIVLKKSTDRNYAAIANVRNRNILISVLGICAIVALSHVLMARLVSRPVEGLAEDIRRLPGRISHGFNLSAMNIVKRTDEIGTLQKSFNRMAMELDEKTHAIEETSMELAKANKELEAFAYSVSHDLRAPLRNIDGFSKILLEEFSEKLDEKARHYLNRVRNGTMRMSVLIDDMLTFSRIGRTELQLRRTSCRDMISSIIEYYANEIAAKNISISLGAVPDIHGDPVLIQSLFSNLVSNALKYTRTIEKPEIMIGYDMQKEAIFVKDNGIGFDMQYHDKIFQVFQRLHLPEEYEGTGIGLAIVKRIAERHKGAAWAESKLNEGATFYVKLPVIKEEEYDKSVYPDSAR